MIYIHTKLNIDRGELDNCTLRWFDIKQQTVFSLCKLFFTLLQCTYL